MLVFARDNTGVSTALTTRPDHALPIDLRIFDFVLQIFQALFQLGFPFL